MKRCGLMEICCPLLCERRGQLEMGPLRMPNFFATAIATWTRTLAGACPQGRSLKKMFVMHEICWPLLCDPDSLEGPDRQKVLGWMTWNWVKKSWVRETG